LDEVFMGFSQKIYLKFWLKPVTFNKKYPHAKASGNSFRAFILPNEFHRSFTPMYATYIFFELDSLTFAKL